MDYEDLFLTAAAAAVIAFAPPAAKAEPRIVEERAQAAAEEGPDALRQFVWRTRMIYALDIRKYSAYLTRQASGDATDDGTWTGLAFFEEPFAGAWLEAGYGAPFAQEADSHD